MMYSAVLCIMQRFALDSDPSCSGADLQPWLPSKLRLETASHEYDRTENAFASSTVQHRVGVEMSKGIVLYCTVLCSRMQPSNVLE